MRLYKQMPPHSLGTHTSEPSAAHACHVRKTHGDHMTRQNTWEFTTRTSMRELGRYAMRWREGCVGQGLSTWTQLNVPAGEQAKRRDTESERHQDREREHRTNKVETCGGIRNSAHRLRGVSRIALRRGLGRLSWVPPAVGATVRS